MRKILTAILTAAIFMALGHVILSQTEIFSVAFSGLGDAFWHTGDDLIQMLRPLTLYLLLTGAPLIITLIILFIYMCSKMTSKSTADFLAEMAKPKTTQKGNENA